MRSSEISSLLTLTTISPSVYPYEVRFVAESSNTFQLLNLLVYVGSASDKCGVESECLSFRQYMGAASQVWTQYVSPLAGNTASMATTGVVVTTESKAIHFEVSNYANETESVFPMRIITNHRDVMQNTGFIEGERAGQPSADDAMISAISSLKAQLTTRVTVGNCCSNFHLLLSDFLRSGCGASSVNTFQCLQDHPDPEYRICCRWDKTETCNQRRATNKQE